MSRENVLNELDQIRSLREAGAPLSVRIPVYLRTASELAFTPGARKYALDFLLLSGKASATVVFQSAVSELEKQEPAITGAIEKTGDLIVSGLNKINR